MSEIKVNKVTPRVACGTTQLGDSGDTFTIPSGATITNAGTASGFGATGETSWDTTVKTTGTFTATAGVGYFLNTTGGIITVNLPAGAAGSSVALADYAGTWQTNNVTVAANGTEKIGGVDADVTLSTEGQAVTFVYIDGTQGWVNVLDSTSNVRGNEFVVATGGTPCAGQTSGDYKYHTFTGPGTFCVSAIGPAANNLVSYMVIAGGGAGGGAPDGAGGGGAGGFREYKNSCDPYTASPLNGNPGGTAITVSASPYAIAVGGGGPSNPASVYNAPQGAGSVSSFSSITSTGGGDGGLGDQIGPSNPTATNSSGAPGGSGGGGGTYNTGAPPTGQGTVGSGNTPLVSPAQGQNGGTGATDNATYRVGGGGGGAGAVGASTSNPAPAGGVGGAGVTTSINATPTARSGGGGGGGHPGGSRAGGVGGSGGGGNGGQPAPATAGAVNTGGGGGGSSWIGGGTASGAGGSGIVVIRYKFQ